MKKILSFGVLFFWSMSSGCGEPAAQPPQREQLSVPRQNFTTNTESQEIENSEELPLFGDGTTLQTSVLQSQSFPYPPPTSQPPDRIDRVAVCPRNTRLSNASQTITYSDPDRGIEFRFPYDPEMGDPEHNTSPYRFLEHPDNLKLRFGPVGTVDGCKYPQYYILEFVPARSAEHVLNQLQNANWMDAQPRKVTIGNVTAIEYEFLGLCEHPRIQVIGEKYNYEFYPICGEREELEVLRLLVETVDLK